jgi:hypothetical protein
MQETDWAYLAGMIDGEGHIGLFRHYKKNCNVSKRGYEIEPRLNVTNMNKQNLIIIKEIIQLGSLITCVYRRKGIEPFEGYELRFGVNDQRIIYPKIITYLIQKKELAEIILKLLDYRLNKKDREFTEKFYLELEEEFRTAVMKGKPWLLKAFVNGKLCNRNKNLVRGFQNHTYIKNIEPTRTHNQKGEP